MSSINTRSVYTGRFTDWLRYILSMMHQDYYLTFEAVITGATPTTHGIWWWCDKTHCSLVILITNSSNNKPICIVIYKSSLSIQITASATSSSLVHQKIKQVLTKCITWYKGIDHQCSYIYYPHLVSLAEANKVWTKKDQHKSVWFSKTIKITRLGEKCTILSTFPV